MFKNALDVIPGGVNSPVRSFNAVDSSPIYIKRAKGAYLYDEDKNKYIDYIGSFGPLILGHSNSSIIKSASKAMEKGTTYGACHKNEIVLAKLISENIKSMEMVRLTSHKVKLENITVESKMKLLLDSLKERDFISLPELILSGESKLAVSVILTAALELNRKGYVEIVQAEQFGEIYFKGAEEVVH